MYASSLFIWLCLESMYHIEEEEEEAEADNEEKGQMRAN